MSLVTDMGFDSVDGGLLQDSCRQQPSTTRAAIRAYQIDRQQRRRSSRGRRASASSSADTQNDTSMVFDKRHASTARLAQSITATR